MIEVITKGTFEMFFFLPDSFYFSCENIAF